ITMVTSKQRWVAWRCCAMALSALIVADWIAALSGQCLLGLGLMTLALLISFGVIVVVAVGLVVTGLRVVPVESPAYEGSQASRYNDPVDYRYSQEAGWCEEGRTTDG